MSKNYVDYMVEETKIFLRSTVHPASQKRWQTMSWENTKSLDMSQSLR